MRHWKRGEIMSLYLWKGDITKIRCEAIVNAANKTLLGGGGVDGAIHRAAGPLLLEECRQLGGCETGDSKITKGYNLPAKYVIHAVGPVWHGGKDNEDELLKSAYLSSLKWCVDYNIKSVAFPAISTGVYGFPIERATYVAINAVKEFVKDNEYPKDVIFVTYSERDFNVYKKIMDEVLKGDYKLWEND